MLAAQQTTWDIGFVGMTFQQALPCLLRARVKSVEIYSTVPAGRAMFNPSRHLIGGVGYEGPPEILVMK
jgi:hypothetical protein